MTEPKRDNRKAALAQIHIGKKQLGLDDDTYRQMLMNVTGKRSCSDMALAELYQVIKVLENAGFKKQRNRRSYYSPKSKGQIIDVMRAIWIEMYKTGIVRDGSELALNHWAKRASSKRNGGIGVDSLEWLERDAELASKVLEDLKQWNKRIQSEWRAEDFKLIRTLQNGRNVAELVRQLLDDHRIMWWPEFSERLQIENQSNYCSNRKELNYGD